MTNQSVSLSDNLVRDALQTWNTSIVESGNDFNRMKSTLTAIMPQIVQKSDIETAALDAAKTNQLRQNRRYKKLLRRCSQLNNALIKAKASKPDNMAAVQAAIDSIIIHEEANGYEWRGEGGDYTPKSHEIAMLADFGHGLMGVIEDALRALSAEPAQGSYSVTDELRDLQQSILQSKTLADFNAVKKTVEALTGPTSEAEV